MALIADILLLLAAATAALYCRILAQRLKRLGATDQGLGGAISTLSVQVDELQASLKEIRTQTDQRAFQISETTNRAEVAARQLELLLASLHRTETTEPSDPDRDPRVLKLSPKDLLPQIPASGSKSRLILRSNAKRLHAGTGVS
jgi:hypothetical protein